MSAFVATTFASKDAAELMTALTAIEGSAEGVFSQVQCVPAILAVCANKKAKEAAAKAPAVVDAIYARVPVPALPAALVAGLTVGKDAPMGNAAKFQTKVAALQLLSKMAAAHPEQVAVIMPTLVPLVDLAMWETKKQVKDQAKQTMIDICNVIQNMDIKPFVPDMIEAILDREVLNETINALGSTTFVQTFEASALSLVMPILTRGFKRVGETATQRKCAVITDNMFKLVKRPYEVQAFMPVVEPYVKKGLDTIADPEARDRFEKAHAVLIKVSTSKADDGVLETVTEKDMAKELKANKFAGSKDELAFAATVCRDMANFPTFMKKDWAAALAAFNVDAEASDAVVAAAAKACGGQVDQTFEAEESKGDDDEDDSVPDLCNLQFSLAYGTNILLNSARLHCKRGYKYGIIASKSAGKTTMMRAIANGQVEGFPSQDELRSIFIENDIAGEQLQMNVVEYVKDTIGFGLEYTDEEVIEMLESIGFTNDPNNSVACYTGPITSLSGGWKMKLALGRATMQKADIMLMDEPTNHLDVINVQWVVDYLNSPKLANTSCLIVSHDTKFLDKTISRVIHFDNLKLKTYKGNITDFVARFPWAKSYFELKSTSVVFKFPTPLPLMGPKGKPVKPATPILSMKNVRFTYPGATKPQLTGVTVMLSMISRVAIVGANGAGKSTMIKLLTGELNADGGVVKKNANMRFAYVAQHAFHHIEQHLEKTPNEYIRWRYEGGEDKESLKKAEYHVSDDEKQRQEAKIEVSWVDETTEKTMKEKRVIESIVSRKADKKSYIYEVKWVGKLQGQNSWYGKEFLYDHGWEPVVKALDSRLLALEGMQQRPLTSTNVEKHLVNVGLETEYGSHCRIRDLSGGQKVKVVLAACTWACPHIIILDEPTNYLDRDSLGALAQAIISFEGGVCLITHNKEFADATTRETWVVGNNVCDVSGDPEWEKYAMEDHTMEEQDEYQDASGNTHKVKKQILIADMSKKDIKKYKKIIKDKIKNQRELDEQEQGWADEWDIDWE